MFGQQLRRAATAALALLALSTSASLAPRAHAADSPLAGTLALTAGACASGKASGTYFRMVQPSGTVADGPFVTNGDSSCADQTFTLLAPGTDGGVILGAHQPAPNPIFDANGNAKANRITQPATFFGRKFGLSTDPTDLQTKTAVPALSVSHDGNGVLSADTRAWSATWNNQFFNQGAPKPDGSRPGLSQAAKGTFNASTGAFVLEWASTIVGGPFNNFTGYWHLEGTVRGATSAQPAAPPAASGAKATSGGSPDATTTTLATTADATPTVAADDTTNETVQAVKATESKGWNPPAWLIVVTALAGVVAAVSLLSTNRRTES